MERFLKRIHASLYFSNKNWIYIHMCMNFDVLNFGLLDFHSDSLNSFGLPDLKSQTLNGIWNDLELQRKSWKHLLSLKQLYWRYSKRFGTTEKNENVVSIKHTFWHYLKWFGTAEKILKTMSLKHVFFAFWYYLKRFWTAANTIITRLVNCALWWYFKRCWTADKNENRAFKSLYSVTIWTIFWNFREKLKTRTINDAFWRYFILYFDLQRKFWKQSS